MSIFYKILDANLCSMYGGEYRWTLGEWAPEVPIIPCASGYHVCQESDLVYWLGPVIAECEVGRTIRHVSHLGSVAKTVTDRCRIVRVFETWNERTQRLFACDCAEHVLPLYECKHPLDDRVRKAIEMTRAYAVGEVGIRKLHTALRAACDVANMVSDTVSSAVVDAAIYAASISMADNVFRNAASNAAWAAGYAANDTWSAEWTAAHLVEHEW